MKLSIKLLLRPALLVVASTMELHAQPTAFTYQGRLDAPGSPAGGSYDLRFAIYDASAVGNAVAGPLTNIAAIVSNGLFTTTLDFGANVFTGGSRWLEIGVRTNGGDVFSTLAPRQPITPSPYAIYAGGVNAVGISGAIPSAALGGTYGNAVNFTNVANSFAGSGAGLTQLNASQLKSGTVDDARLPASIARTNQVWLLGGNSGTTAGTHFFGTSDNQPVEIKVNGFRALRLEDKGDGSDPNLLPDGAPNVIGGSMSNAVSPNVVGATISGGGATNQNGAASPNTIASDYGVIGGGLGNRIAASSQAATIAGGFMNDIGFNAAFSAVLGGQDNNIASNTVYGTIGGGWLNDLGVKADFSVLAGGWANDIGNDARWGVIGGGQANTIGSASEYSTIPGGQNNHIASNVFYAFAAGRRAKANHTGAFVWADSEGTDFESTTTNQFNVRARGGVRLETGGTGLLVDGVIIAGSNAAPVELSGTYTNAVSFPNAANSFAGNGNALTALNASQLTSGTIPSGRLAGTYSGFLAFNNPANTYAGNGGNLTSLNASQLASGTVADARLSANVALRNAAQTFTATNIFSTSIGVGGVSPTARLDVNGQVRIRGGSPGAGKVLTSDATGTAVWSPSKASSQVVVVDAAGNGDYSSVSAALAAITPTVISPYVIEVRPGLYFDRVVMKSHVHLKGAGASATVIMFNVAGAAGNADLAVVRLNNLTNVAVSDLTLTTRAYTNAALNEACVGIYDLASSPTITACRFVSLEGNQPTGSFANEVFGVASSGSTPVIRDCHFESGQANDAISLYQSSGAISDNAFAAHWHALYLTQSSAQFLNNRLNEVAEAVRINASSEATVGFNHFTGPSGETAVFNDGEARIIGNEISGAHEVGIDNQGEAAILGNTLTGCTESGIRDNGSARTTISGNLLSNCSGGGERALALVNSSAVVVGNTFASNTFGDIAVAGSGSPTINNNRTTGAVSGAATIAGFGTATVSANPTNLFLNATSGVGIGEVAPEGQLHITGNPATPQIKIETTSNNSFVKLRLESFGKPYWDFAVGGSANVMNWFYSATSQNLMSLSTNGTLTTVGPVNPPSDRNVKQDFAQVNSLAVLEKVSALPIQSWAYKNSPETRHIGPVAQDFHAAFQFNGADDKHISTVDADGVALAAIQGLNQKVEVRSQKSADRSRRLEQRLEQKETEIVELQQRLAALERLVSQLNPKGE